MEFQKERCFTSLNADELKQGDKVIVANSLSYLRHCVECDECMDEIVLILSDDNRNRFYISGSRPFALAYLVERAENCTNCGAIYTCAFQVREHPELEKCKNWKPKNKPKTEQKAEKMNESGELGWGMNCCMVCDFYNKDNHRCLVDRDEVLNPSLNTCQYYTPRSPKKCEDCVYHYYEDKFDSICRCNMNGRPTTPAQAKTCKYFLREEAEPHYRPFRDTDELLRVWEQKAGEWGDTLWMPYIWVRRDSTSERCLIVSYTNDSVYLGYRAVSLHELWEHFTFLDGSTCGVEE